VSNVARLTVRLNRLRDELAAVSARLLREHLSHDVTWIVQQKQRIDWLTRKITMLERRVR
jgi:hypothetical protein